jgi:hypothetical protein
MTEHRALRLSVEVVYAGLPLTSSGPQEVAKAIEAMTLLPGCPIRFTHTDSERSHTGVIHHFWRVRLPPFSHT